MFLFKKKKDLDRERLDIAVAHYPIYQPPHAQPFPRNSLQEAQENFSYFSIHKAQRVKYFLDLIRTLNTDATIADENLSAVDLWANNYGCYLAGNDRLAESESFFDFKPFWSGEYRRLNIVWDLSIYMGDIICSMNPQSLWILDVGDDDPISRTVRRYHRPCILLNDPAQPLRRLDTAQDMLLLMRAKKEAKDLGRDRPDFSGFANADALKNYVKRWTRTQPIA